MEQSSVFAAEIERRLGEVRGRIVVAAERAGRSPDQVRIVAVSKTHPAEVVRAGYQSGLRLFGENRVEEAQPKQGQLTDLAELEWHMVGHIQSRKARGAAATFDAVHSVDRMKIARRLDRAAQGGARLKVLLECNVSAEAAKDGWPLANSESWPAILDEFAAVLELPNLQVLGLMTMAPLVPDPEQTRPVFRKLRELRDFLRYSLPGDWPELSMGMTDDFEVAVEEGATLLRIGRAIFGPRQGA